MKDIFERYCSSNLTEMELTDVYWSSSLSGRGSRNYTFVAKNVRDRYKDYFNSRVGAVSWQEEVLNSNL